MSGRHIVMATVGSQGDLFPFLAVGRELRERGYRTGAAVSAYVLRASTGANAGFDSYDDAIGIVEGVIYLTKSDPEFVATYVQGRKEWF